MNRKQFVLGGISSFALYCLPNVNGIFIDNMTTSGRVAIYFTGILETGATSTGKYIIVSGAKSPSYYHTSGQSMFFRER